MQKVILAIDEGTTNVKSLLINTNGEVVGKGASLLTIHHPAPNEVTQDPLEIIEKVKLSLAQALDSVDGEVDIDAVAISNQRESVLLWERSTGKPLTDVISWQSRTSEQLCNELRADEGFSRYVLESTGLTLDPMFPATKVSLALENIPNAIERAQLGEICLGTINSWLIWHLCDGVFITDASNAARTQLYNIRNNQWDLNILKRLNIPLECLPEVVSSAEIVGYSKAFGRLKNNTPIASQIGDSHAALYGHGGFQAGVVKATYGTGSSVMAAMTEKPKVRKEISATIAWQQGDIYYGLEGNITHTGSAIDWVRRMLGVVDMPSMCDLAASADKSHDVYFVPALSGLGAPYWDLEASGLFCGLKSSTSRAEMARSAFESVLYQVADVFNVIAQEQSKPLDRLCVDGGPTQNDWLMQAQADLLGVTIQRSEITEVSALGAGYLAGIAIGWWSNKEALSELSNKVTLFTPREEKYVYWQKRYVGWQTAVSKCRFNGDS